MPDEWLLEVLCDIEDYAILNSIYWLVPLINKVNVIAKTEIGRSGGLQPVRLDNVKHLSPRKTKEM